MDEVIKNLKMDFPFLARELANIYEIGYNEYIVELNDGDRFVYDISDKTFRCLPPIDETLTETECRTEFGERLRKVMLHKQVSQNELSYRTGISAPVISNYINGKNTPSFYAVNKIVRALDCSLDDLRYI